MFLWLLAPGQSQAPPRSMHRRTANRHPTRRHEAACSSLKNSAHLPMSLTKGSLVGVGGAVGRNLRGLKRKDRGGLRGVGFGRSGWAAAAQRERGDGHIGLESCLANLAAAAPPRAPIRPFLTSPPRPGPSCGHHTQRALSFYVKNPGPPVPPRISQDTMPASFPPAPPRPRPPAAAPTAHSQRGGR